MFLILASWTLKASTAIIRPMKTEATLTESQPAPQGTTYDAEDMARLLSTSTWTIYEHVRRGDFPFDPIRVGRLLRWPKAFIDDQLGIADRAE
jgi:predicted DNA-binding transcriptional regulator AlpA